MRFGLALSLLVCCLIVAVCGCTDDVTDTKTAHVTQTTTQNITESRVVNATETQTQYTTVTQTPTLTKTITVTRNWPPTLEKAGNWDFSSFPGLENASGFERERYIAVATTINVVVINGRDYLVLSFHSTHGGESSLLVIYDLTDPTSPSFVSSLVHPEEEAGCVVNDVAIKDGTLYAGLFGGVGLWIVDISNPASPVDLGIAPVVAIGDVVAAGHYVYSCNLSRNIVISDASNIRDVQQMQTIDVPYGECELSVNGSLLFVGIKDSLLIYDISSPDLPVKLAGYTLAVAGDTTTILEWVNMAQYWRNWATIQDVEASGHYVFVAFGAGGVRVIDISNPTAPREIASIDLGGFAIALTLKDNLVYATKSEYDVQKLELVVVDISKLEKPVLIGALMTEYKFAISGICWPYYFFRPQVVGDFIYVAGKDYLDIFELR